MSAPSIVIMHVILTSVQMTSFAGDISWPAPYPHPSLQLAWPHYSWLQQFRVKSRLSGIFFLLSCPFDISASIWTVTLAVKPLDGAVLIHTGIADAKGEKLLAWASGEMQHSLLNIHSQFKKGNAALASGLPLALIRNSWAKPNAQLFLKRD